MRSRSAHGSMAGARGRRHRSRTTQVRLSVLDEILELGTGLPRARMGRLTRYEEHPHHALAHGAGFAPRARRRPAGRERERSDGFRYRPRGESDPFALDSERRRTGQVVAGGKRGRSNVLSGEPMRPWQSRCACCCSRRWLCEPREAGRSDCALPASRSWRLSQSSRDERVIECRLTIGFAQSTYPGRHQRARTWWPRWLPA